MAQQSGIQSLRVVLGALLLGMTSFAAVAAFLGPSKGAADPKLFLIALAVMGPVELILYRLAVRPAIIRQAAQALRAGATDAAMEARFTAATILAAALAEGWGLFGCVIVMISGQWAALVAPACAAAVLGSLLDVRGRFERFKQEAASLP